MNHQLRAKYRLNLLGPLAAAILIALAVCLNHHLCDYFHIRHSRTLTYLPFFPAFLMVGAMILMGFLVVKGTDIWEKRESILLFLLILTAQTPAVFKMGFLDLSDIVVGISLVILLMDKILHMERKVVISPLNLFILLFMFFMLLSCVNGGIGSLITFVRDTKSILSFFLITNLITDRKRVNLALKALIIATTLSCIVGIFQETVYFTTGKALVGMVDRKSLRYIVSKSDPAMRAPAFFGYPQGFANVLATNIPILLYILLASDAKFLGKRYLLWPALILMGVNLIFTFSRGSWASALITTLLLMYVWKPQYFFHFSAGLLALLIFCYFTGILELAYKTIYVEMGRGDVAYRLQLFRQNLQGSLHKHPWIGVGLDKAKKYTPTPYGYSVHNAFAMALAEIGIFGFLAYCLLYLVALFRLLYALTVVKLVEDKVLLKAYLLGLLAFFLYLQIDPLFHLLYTWIFFALLEGSVLVFLKEYKNTAGIILP